jgi:hypothetical protein
MNTTLKQSAAPPTGAPVGPTGAQPEALIKEAWQRRRRRRQAGGAVVASALLVAALVAFVVTQGTASRRPGGLHLPSRPGQAMAAAMPPRIVAWAGNFLIEVRSSRTGRIVRTLATHVAEIRGLPALSLSASGTLYFDDWSGPHDRTHDQVRSVPLTGGPVVTVANDARLPAVSPDGRLLAYVTNTDGSSAPEAIVVRNLVTGAKRRWAFATKNADVAAISWSPDDHSLSFTLGPTRAGAFYIGAPSWVLDTRQPSGSLRHDARRIPLRGRVSWACYLTARTGVGVIERPVSTTLVLVDAATGRVIRPLITLRTELFTSNVSDGPEETIQADPTGRYLLIAVAGPGGYGEVLRWAFGMHRPVPVAVAVGRAIWTGATR